MKQLYVCEKCGTQYEDYDKAYECERSHCNLGYEFANETQKFNTWKQGDILPRTAVLGSELIYRYDEETGESHHEFMFGVYKFERLLKPEESNRIREEHEDAERKSREEWDRWREEHNAKKSSEVISEETVSE